MAMSLFILDDTTMFLRFGWKYVSDFFLEAWRCEGKDENHFTETFAWRFARCSMSACLYGFVYMYLNNSSLKV